MYKQWIFRSRSSHIRRENVSLKSRVIFTSSHEETLIHPKWINIHPVNNDQSISFNLKKKKNLTNDRNNSVYTYPAHKVRSANSSVDLSSMLLCLYSYHSARLLSKDLPTRTASYNEPTNYYLSVYRSTRFAHAYQLRSSRSRSSSMMIL